MNINNMGTSKRIQDKADDMFSKYCLNSELQELIKNIKIGVRQTYY